MQHQNQSHLALDWVDQDFDGMLERLFQFLRVPSVSTDPAFAEGCVDAATMMAKELQSLGFDARVAPTEGHPMVVAHHDGPGPHILFYGHYDVQPVDPIDLWETDPFQPQIKTREDGSQYVVARGASDDKAQLRTFVEACRALKATVGALPCQITILLEGEEESGSKSLDPFLHANAEELSADLVLICDTPMWDRDTPAITVGLRGMAAGEVTISAAVRDLHSGIYGGPALNPIQVLCDILATVKRPDGSVALPGFYDGVSGISDEVRDSWQSLGFDDAAFLGEVGLTAPAGEQGSSVLEQCWARPTAEINGIVGGYIAEGFKTVIPAHATAKVSFRLVGNQDPKKVWKGFENHVRERLPADAKVTFCDRGGSRAISIASDSQEVQAVRHSLHEEWGKPAALLGCGGSIPVVSSLRDILGLESILVGFALNDDNIHSPNEKYELKSFRKGIRSWIRILSAIGTPSELQHARELTEA